MAIPKGVLLLLGRVIKEPEKRNENKVSELEPALNISAWLNWTADADTDTQILVSAFVSTFECNLCIDFMTFILSAGHINSALVARCCFSSFFFLAIIIVFDSTAIIYQCRCNLQLIMLSATALLQCHGRTIWHMDGHKNQKLAAGHTFDLTFVVFLSFVLFMFIYLMPSYRI